MLCVKSNEMYFADDWKSPLELFYNINLKLNIQDVNFFTEISFIVVFFMLLEPQKSQLKKI